MEYATLKSRIPVLIFDVWSGPCQFGNKSHLRQSRGPNQSGLAAHAKSLALEPDNWRHILRYAHTAWGEERMTMARRVIALVPDLAVPRWLLGSVFVARGASGEAERQVDQGIAVMSNGQQPSERFAALGLHWMKGLLVLDRGAVRAALASFEGELARAAIAHIYGREMTANTRSAIGACHHLCDEPDAARAAYHESLACVTGHPISTAGLALLDGTDLVFPPDTRWTFDHTVAQGIVLASRGNIERGADLLLDAVVNAAPGPTGWRLWVEPLLQVNRNRERWARVLSVVANRAM